MLIAFMATARADIQDGVAAYKRGDYPQGLEAGSYSVYGKDQDTSLENQPATTSMARIKIPTATT